MRWPLILWLVVSELDCKPERKLGELEKVRKGESGEVDAAVDPVRFLDGDRGGGGDDDGRGGGLRCVGCDGVGGLFRHQRQVIENTKGRSARRCRR